MSTLCTMSTHFLLHSAAFQKGPQNMRPFIALCLAFISPTAFGDPAMDLYKMPDGAQTRWYSFENPTGAKGAAAHENKTAKGHPCDSIAAGQTVVLADIKGAGE